MIPPTSIDGTDITGATIDGTDVQEITVDGDVVFSATTFPVAYSNLIAWYPFDSAEYGGSNGDDVTAILGGSGDDTAYNGTVVGANYVSSGGVTDIRAGANSGAYDFSNNTDSIDVFPSSTINVDKISITTWIGDVPSGNRVFFNGTDTNSNSNIELILNPSYGVIVDDDNDVRIDKSVSRTNVTHHYGMTYDNGSLNMYIDGSSVLTDSISHSFVQINEWSIGNFSFVAGSFQDDSIRGVMDDFRIYNDVLSGSQINQIYQNTKPP